MSDSDKTLPSSSNQETSDGAPAVEDPPVAQEEPVDEAPAEEPAAQTSDVGKPNPILQTVAAVVFILGYLAIFAYLLVNSDTADDKQWLRMTFLFGSIEALVFAVAGFLFGQSIRNPREFKLQQAESDAKKKADQEAARAAELEEAGAELAEIVERQNVAAAILSRGEESATIQGGRDIEAALYHFKKVVKSTRNRG